MLTRTMPRPRQSEVEELKERIAQLEATLLAGQSNWLEFGLSTTESRLFASLMNLTLLHRGSLQLLMSDTHKEAVSENAETAAMYRIRKKLKKYGIEIKTKPRTGYYLTPHDKTKARALFGTRHGNFAKVA